jgi:asparagine synthase (glutamine-hydrolysing)
MSPGERYATWMSVFDEPARRRLFEPEFAATLTGVTPEEYMTTPWALSTADNNVDRMLDTDVEMYLPAALLVKMDIATMAYSVEARSPFLDQELMQFAAALPADLKLAGISGKRILKHALRSWLPKEILERRKMGFGVPLANWFRTELRELPEQILLDPVAIGRGYFRRAEIERLIRDHQAGAADRSTQIWALLQLEMWHREVVEAPGSSSSLAVRASVA